jgi:hypothetical protein
MGRKAEVADIEGAGWISGTRRLTMHTALIGLLFTAAALFPCFYSVSTPE